MPQQLEYNYDAQTIYDLHARALGIFGDLCEAIDIPAMVQPNVYNSILNMVAQVKVSPIAVAPRMDIPRGQG